MIEISISPEFGSAGVDISLGLLTYPVPARATSVDFRERFEVAVAAAAEVVADRKPADLEEIAKTRRAFKALGKDPSRYRPSSEALFRRIASGKGLWSVGEIVDANNVVSLTTKWPVGTYDLDKITPPIELRIGRASEVYEGVERGEINIDQITVLADQCGPFGTPFSDSERTKVTHETKRVLTVIYQFCGGDNGDEIMKVAVMTLQHLCNVTQIETQIPKNERP